mmetsp:Transcript_34796/g.75454  ORF Transcript_34796/g.75454 Transcript_34796/m.75454 type:complete len:281 (+) Transcript_34796:1048-1890(+)
MISGLPPEALQLDSRLQAWMMTVLLPLAALVEVDGRGRRQASRTITPPTTRTTRSHHHQVVPKRITAVPYVWMCRLAWTSRPSTTASISSASNASTSGPRGRIPVPCARFASQRLSASTSRLLPSVGRRAVVVSEARARRRVRRRRSRREIRQPICRITRWLPCLSLWRPVEPCQDPSPSSSLAALGASALVDLPATNVKIIGGPLGIEWGTCRLANRHLPLGGIHLPVDSLHLVVEAPLVPQPPPPLPVHPVPRGFLSRSTGTVRLHIRSLVLPQDTQA